MPRSLIVIPLGEIAHDEALRLVQPRFPTARVVWLERGDLRCRPAAVVWKLVRHAFDDAVLVAPDLRAPRVRLTSMLLSLPRARRRWRLDQRGEAEPFATSAHVRGSAWPLTRHAVACVLALVLGTPALIAVDLMLRVPRRQKRPTRRVASLLYLRSQFWFGLRGGGSVAHTAGVIGGLTQADVQVEVVSSDRLQGVQAPVRVVPPETWFDGGLREVEELAYNVPFALRALAAARPDAIYQRYAAFNVTGAVVSRLRRVPLVLEFNSSEVWKGRYWGGLRRFGWAERVEQINLRAADHIVVVSRPLRDQLIAAGVPARKIVVNPNGVDPGLFGPHVSGAAVRASYGLGDRVVVGFSGTFGVWHGIPTLTAALPLFLSARPEVTVLLMGDGPLRPMVDAATRTHRLGERVIQVGLVPHERMPEHLAACDILLSPHGRQADGGDFFGSPTKLFEYMAAGRAIVASRVGQIGEVLRDEESALVVPPDDAEALSAAVLRLVDDAALRARLASAARRDAERSHTWRANAERVLEMLASPEARRT